MRLTVTRDEWAQELAEAAGAAYANEAELRHALNAILAPYCTDVVGLENSQIRHEGTSSSGRFDTLLGSTLIEWKTPGELSTKTKRIQHAEQAIRYLHDANIGAVVVIVTDGRTWGILRDPEGAGGEQISLDLEMFPPSADEKFQWRDNSTETAGRVLDLIDAIVFEPVTPQSLMNKMGPTGSAGKSLLKEFVSSIDRRTPDGRTDILYRQWLALAGVSYGIGDNPKRWPKERAVMLGDLSGIIPETGFATTIFALHSYVAFCSKLIAAEALALTRGHGDKRPSQWATLGGNNLKQNIEKLENGVLAEELQAPRMMGGDLFGWHAEEAQSNRELESALRGLIGSFAELSWARLAHATQVSSDLLREFYTRVIPRGLRKGLGEFFTPEWIAERVVDKAISLSAKPENAGLRFLDPSCGSGTFLVAAMRRSIRVAQSKGMESREIAERAIESVTGFDVNPVSPLMARVNLLLVLGDLSDALPEIQFNVFQADSILIPEEPVGQGSIEEIGSAVTVPLVIGNISLPASLATLKAISGLARIVDQSVQRERDVDTFKARLTAQFALMGVEQGDEVEALAAAEILYAKLLKLHTEKRDGVWAHVIEQSFAPRVLEPVDIVVGNPPWISWKNLPPEWRLRSERTWTKWGLWQQKRAGGGTPMGDISTLLLARSISTYSPDGVVALLLPEGTLINDPGGRALRACKLGRADEVGQSFAPLFVDDFSKLNPFPDAATKPIALYIKSTGATNFPIDGSRWDRKKLRTKLPADIGFTAAKELLSEVKQKFAPVTIGDVASPWRVVSTDGRPDAMGEVPASKYTWGQGFHTRGADGIYFCEVVSDSPYAGNLVRIRTRPDLGRNTSSLPSTEALIEAKYLWPLLRGANVGYFKVSPSGLYAIVPHDPDDPSVVLKRSAVIRDAPKMFDYFEPHLERLVSRSAYDMKLSEDYPWGIQGTAWKHIRRSRIMVVSRYMMPDGRPPAAVIQPVIDSKLGFSTVQYPNNKVNFVTCDSLDEADYVAAFVNSDLAQSAIARRVSTTTIGPGTLNGLAMPKFDPRNVLHKVVADVGRECRVSPQAWPSVSPELTKAASRLLESFR